MARIVMYSSPSKTKKIDSYQSRYIIHKNKVYKKTVTILSIVLGLSVICNILQCFF